MAAFPAAVLTGAAFAAPVMAFSATRETDQSFIVLYRFGVVPLFLFSGTFFPISELPGWLQVAARFTPLYQGVSLCRDFVLGPTRRVGRRRPLHLSRGDAGGGSARGQGDVPAKARAMTPSRTARRR